MVNTASHLSARSRLTAIVGFVGLCSPFSGPFGGLAFAQSSAAFATTVYQSPTQISPDSVIPPVSANLQQPVRTTTPPYRGPAPIVMFRPTPPQAKATALVQPEVALPLLKTPQAQIGPLNGRWDPANIDAVIAPPLVVGAVSNELVNPESQTHDARRYQRPPLRAIAQDTGTAIVRGLPEALADALPWVDRRRKDEPFDQVLARVADDLQRSSSGDPAWAFGAQREIRALARRLDSFSAPPPHQQDQTDSVSANDIAQIDGRPFRPRPIWPGASGRPEAQVRPNTLVTPSFEQAGIDAVGVVGRYVSDYEEPETMPTAPLRRSAHTAAQARPTPRR